MDHLKEKLKPLSLAVLIMLSTYGYSYMDSSSNAYGLFSSTGSNKDLINLNNDRPP
jgi:hypothetical protein